MAPVSKGIWRFTLMLIGLMIIVALSHIGIINILEEKIDTITSSLAARQELIKYISITLFCLTTGYIILTGALGLWIIRSIVEIEARRKIARFVDAMDYLSDGIVAVDRKSKIHGANPAARAFIPDKKIIIQDVLFYEAFPILEKTELFQLLDSEVPQEIEKEIVTTSGLRTLRFRTQPSEEFTLILISDVTDIHTFEIRKRQMAQLQLVGRIAAGVAHDFNNILCAISGHSAILQRSDIDRISFKNSLTQIMEETKRGVMLSKQLLEFSRTGTEIIPTEKLSQNIKEAASLLRVALPSDWIINVSTEGEYLAIPLSSNQVEQLILNLGLIAADQTPSPGTITISLHPPGSSGHLLQVDNRFAAIILISCATNKDKTTQQINQAQPQPLHHYNITPEESGVILSVASSIIEEAKGKLDIFSSENTGIIYRVCLPHLDAMQTKNFVSSPYTKEILSYIKNWKIALIGTSETLFSIERKLKQHDIYTEQYDTILKLFSSIETVSKINAIIVEVASDEQETLEGLLKAIRKIASDLAIVLINSHLNSSVHKELKVSILPITSLTLETICNSLLEAKSLVSREK
jgi:signal transduction histidine kinase